VCGDGDVAVVVAPARDRERPTDQPGRQRRHVVALIVGRERKRFPLRIPQELYDAYEAWAADELRSVNAQIEAVLVDAARRARRPPRRRSDASSDLDR
jgi:hypothetical protein